MSSLFLGLLKNNRKIITLSGSGWRYGPASSLDRFGKLKNWFGGSFGDLGDNTAIFKYTPTNLAGVNKTFCRIATGRYNSFAIDKNGKLWAWGRNLSGSLGDNTIVDKSTPVAVAGANKTFCQITSGENFTIALDKNGRAWGWGVNIRGCLGDNTIVSKSTPVSVLGAVKTFCSISTGYSLFTLGLTNTGRLWAWGSNFSYELGNNDSVSKRTPVCVCGAIKTFCKISAGYEHSGAIDKNGKIWTWGANIYKCLGDLTTTYRATPVAICGAAKTFCEISAGTYYYLALDKNGKAWGWGYNGLGDLGTGDTVCYCTPVAVVGSNKTFCKIFARGADTGLAIDYKGSVWGWGYQQAIGNVAIVCVCTPVIISGGRTFCNITAGNITLCHAIDKNGRIYGWGVNAAGIGNPASIATNPSPTIIGGTTKTFCAVGTGSGFGAAIDKNGRLWSWGSNVYGNLGNNSVTAATTPISVCGAVKTFCKIAVGTFNCYSIDKNGRAWSWGYNFSGALGDNSVVCRSTPVSIAGAIKTFCQIIANSKGNNSAFAIDKNGLVWGWGSNGNGLLGNNSIISISTPVSVAGARKTFCKLALGNHAIAIDKNGRLWAWGFNAFGNLGDNTIVDKSTPISVGGAVKTFCEIGCNTYSSFAIDKNGKLWAWGYNQYGQLGDNTTVNKSTPITVAGINKTFCKVGSGDITIAIEKNGQIWTWGNNTNGILGINYNPSQLLSPRKILTI